jgi:hypothetical protein
MFSKKCLEIMLIIKNDIRKLLVLRFLLLLLWRYSPGWALASNPIHLQTSRSLALPLHSFNPIFLRSVDTSSSHLVFGLPLRLVAYSFQYILLGIAVSCILSMWPSHCRYAQTNWNITNFLIITIINERGKMMERNYTIYGKYVSESSAKFSLRCIK